MLSTKFQVSWPFVAGGEKKTTTDFQDDGHLGLRIGTILTSLALQDTPMLPTKFQVS